MTPPMDLDRLSSSARSADHRDGLLELMAAGLLVVLALSWWTVPSMAGIASLPFIFFGWRSVLWAKERITYPRIGYSAQKEDPEPVRVARFVLFFAVLGGLVVGVIWTTGRLGDAEGWRRATALFSGAAFAAGFWALSVRSGLWRHRALAGCSAALGVWAWWTGEGQGYDVMVRLLLPLGGIVLLVGVLSLWTFVRTHPRIGP